MDEKFSSNSCLLLLAYSFMKGALNVVMGNAPDIGDSLLQSTQVLLTDSALLYTSCIVAEISR